MRTLIEFEWTRTPSGLIEGRVVADAFCHTMVRSLVGCLLVVGEGRQPPDWAAEMLAAAGAGREHDRRPPRGLTLEEVGYPEADELTPRRPCARRARRTAE